MSWNPHGPFHKREYEIIEAVLERAGRWDKSLLTKDERRYFHTLRYKVLNREKYSEYARKRYVADVEKSREYGREQARKRYKAYPDKIRAWSRRYYSANAEKARASGAKWAKVNVEKTREYKRRWVKANPGKVNAKTAHRRAAKLQATPPWARTGPYADEIRKTYELAALIGWHVDHIHPLKGKNFRGLHVPWNLRIISPEENIRKHNKLLPEFC